VADFDLTAVLGLTLEAAASRLAAAGIPAPTVVRSLPSRTRHELPAVVEWRVARVRWLGATPELVAVPAVPLPPAPSP
jgi:hypothetical protein